MSRDTPILPTPQRMDPGTVLVTGCAGFIGSHTTERLLESGWDVVGIDDFSEGCLGNLALCVNHPRFILEIGDVAEGTTTERIIAKHRPDVIVHLAGLVDVKAAEDDPVRNHRLNVDTTITLGEAAIRHRIRRIVFSSSAAVYGDLNGSVATEASEPRPIGNYGRAKLQCERILRQLTESSSIEVVCLRYFNVFGPRQKPASTYAGVLSVFLEQFHSDIPVTVFGDGLQTRDFIAVEDVAAANALAASHPGVRNLTANICTGTSHTLLDILEILRLAFPEAPPHRFAPSRPKDIRHSCGDPTMAATVLGFKSSTVLEKGLLSLARNHPKTFLSSL